VGPNPRCHNAENLDIDSSTVSTTW